MGAPDEQHPQPRRRGRTERYHIPINAQGGDHSPPCGILIITNVILKNSTNR